MQKTKTKTDNTSVDLQLKEVFLALLWFTYVRYDKMWTNKQICLKLQQSIECIYLDKPNTKEQ